MNTYTRSGAAALAAALTFALAACGGTNTGAAAGSSTATSTAAATTSSATDASGMMSPSSMLSAGSSAPSAGGSTAAVSGEHNAADLTFAQSMIAHHQGAIEMTDLAPTRAASQEVKDLAVRIKAAQGPEIEQMQSWLTAWGAAMSTSTASSSDDGMGGMDHGGMSGLGEEGESASASDGMSMPGMMTDEQMQQLTAASGAAFDKLFLEMMIAHHQGAIEMADTELADGSNPDALALSALIKTSQTAEISEMQQLLQTL